MEQYGTMFRMSTVNVAITSTYLDSSISGDYRPHRRATKPSNPSDGEDDQGEPNCEGRDAGPVGKIHDTGKRRIRSHLSGGPPPL